MLLDELSLSLAPYKKAKRWLIGFSGGMDSTVLLHLLVQLRTRQKIPELFAIHIHHGLQSIADAWPEHCQKICDQLNVSLKIIKVTPNKQASIEEAARKARYQAFTELLTDNDLLITAQHQNDQAETLLFRLFRGSGVRGLGSIPQTRPLGLGLLVRPLLNTPYNKLKCYADQHQLHWIEDPSNQDTHYARNYLRHHIIPKITQYWPQAINNMAQATEHLQEAQMLLNVLAQQDLTTAEPQRLYDWLELPSLAAAPLTSLSEARQKNAISFWLSKQTLQPSTPHWKGWFDLINAKETATPIWHLHDTEIHRSANRVWLLKDDWLIKPTPIKLPIQANQSLPLPNNGTVKLLGNIPVDISFHITYRQGGESIFIDNRGNRELKKLFNEAVIPNFLKQRIPLLQDQQNRIIAIANFPQWFNGHYSKDFTFEWTAPRFNS